MAAMAAELVGGNAFDEFECFEDSFSVVRGENGLEVLGEMGV